jgi:hypothetical protein
VREIRRRRESGEFLKDVAKDFGISLDTVHLIARRKRWTYVV